MRTTLDYIGTQKLNAASSATPSGASDPVTGLPISTGTNSGDFIELTAAQAKQLSKTSVGTLYEGVYQRVKLSATGASNVGTVGTPLFWNEANDTTDPYPVTNTPGSTGTATYEYAGTVIDPSTTPGQYCWIQVNGKATCSFASGSAGTVAQYVTFPTSGADVYATGGAPATNIVVGSLLSVAPAASGLAIVAVTRPQTKF